MYRRNMSGKIKESRIVFKDFDIIAVVSTFWIIYMYIILSPNFCCILLFFLYLNSVNKDDDDDKMS